MSPLYRLLALVCVGSLPIYAAAQDDVRQIDIQSSAPRLAVPPCVPLSSDAESREACRTVTNVLRADLGFEGIFDFVDPKLYEMVPSWSPESPNLDEWRGVFASFLVVTRARVQAGQLSIDVRVWDVGSKQLILDKRYSGGVANPRFFAHTVSDAVMTLTQHRGVARTKIVFTTDREGGREGGVKQIYVMDYDGHRPQSLTRGRILNILPNWASDGKRIAYTSYVPRPDIIVVRPFEGQRPINITQGRGQSFASSFSPDGARVAYASSRNGRMKIWVSRADGAGARQLTSGSSSDTAPTWSPTGREIAFTSNRSGTPQIWVIDSEGLNLRRLTRVGSYNDAPAWSPSRLFSEIAYTSRLEAGGFDIAILDLQSGEVRQITTGEGSCESPSWAPSGRHLVFACQRGASWQISVADRVGRRVKVLAAGPGNNAQPDWGPFRDR